MSYGNRKRGFGQGKVKKARIDLGLAVLQRIALPGVCYSFGEIAAFCECRKAAIQNIEQQALKKLCNALQFRDPTLRDQLATEFFDRRSNAVSQNALRAGGMR